MEPVSAACRPPPAAVLDTNVVLDWLVFRDPRAQALGAAVAGGGLRWLALPRMRAELAAVLARGHLARWNPDSERTLGEFDRWAVLCTEPLPSRLRCRDADDQPFIDLALAQRADWLVTHDRALLTLARRAQAAGVRIVRPGAWAA